MVYPVGHVAEAPLHVVVVVVVVVVAKVWKVVLFVFLLRCTKLAVWVISKQKRQKE